MQGIQRPSASIAWLFLMALLLAACQQDDDDGIPQPVINYLVEYRIEVVSEVEVESITYLDSLGQVITVPGTRDFRYRFRASTGDPLSISSQGNITLGYAGVIIEAYAANRPVEIAQDEIGFAEEGTIDFSLQASMTLP